MLQGIFDAPVSAGLIQMLRTWSWSPVTTALVLWTLMFVGAVMGCPLLPWGPSWKTW